jgi:hypothetical protein
VENLPESVQIGPYTYDILSDSSYVYDSTISPEFLTIRVRESQPEQKKATALLRAISQVIFEMMGNAPEDAYEMSLPFSIHFASTLAASPDVMAWTMAALLEGRGDGKSNRVGDNWHERANDLLKEEARDQCHYTVSEDSSRMTIITSEMDDVIPSTTPRGFYQDAFGQYWQRRINVKNKTDVMIPVIITAKHNDQQPYHVPESVAKFLDQLHLTSCEAVEQGLAHVHNGVLKLYRNGQNS